MQKLNREELMSLETYAERRPEFRAEVLSHKKNRQVGLGKHATLYFEDRLTIQYQIQEMLRIERIFEPQGIVEELDAYNPLIPDGTNLKATFMIEYDDVEERKAALAKLRGIEDRVWIEISGHERVYAIANEDLERSNEEKTSAVHFMRFELGEAAAEALASGASMAMGVDHPAYEHRVEPVAMTTRDALAADVRPRAN